MSGASPPAPARFAMWDPSGRRFAAIGGDSGDLAVLLVDPTEGTLTTIPLKQSLLEVAPAWLDANRLALATGRAQDPTSVVVDTASAKITRGPGGERQLATSADGVVVATSAGPGEPVVLRSAKGWLADDGTSIGSVDVPEGFSQATGLALDATGRRLAIVWLREDGSTESHVHDGNDGWRRVLSTAATAVAWLR